MNQQHEKQAVVPNNNTFMTHNHSYDIHLAEIWHAVWQGKVLIISITFLFAMASSYFAIIQPNTYKASALLTPAQSSSGAGGLGALAGQFGGLASMAGINLGGQEQDNTGLALEILKSRAFTESFIEEHNLLVPLMAVKEWDIYSNQLIYDEDIYKSESKEWVRDVQYPKTTKPSSWEAYEEFKKHITISKDKESGMINIAVEYFSPELAKHWLSLIISDINKHMRVMDKTEAQNSIDFLTKKLEQTQLSGMQSVFYQLIEEQTKTMMLTEVTDEYVLKIIDPPNVPDDKNSPKRALICVLGIMLGGLLSVFIVLVRYFSARTYEET